MWQDTGDAHWKEECQDRINKTTATRQAGNADETDTTRKTNMTSKTRAADKNNETKRTKMTKTMV